MSFPTRILNWMSSLFVLIPILPHVSLGQGQQNQATLVVEWQPNSEPDLAGYRIYYGTKSRTYSQVVDVGKVTQYRLGDLQPGTRYFIAVTAYDFSGNESNFSDEVSAEAQVTSTPEVYLLCQNYPNPISLPSETTISFYLPSKGLISLEIYDILGKRVRLLSQDEMDIGLHTVQWDGCNQQGYPVSTGTYFYVLKANKILLSKRLIVVH